MTLRDQSDALIARESQALDALRRDRDEQGPGVHRWSLGEFPEQTIRDLRARGFVIGVKGSLYQLGHAEPTSTETPDAHGGVLAGYPEQPSGVSVEAEQLPIPDQPRKARPHFQDAA